MSRLKRSRLLNFLSEPRYRREITKHFNVPFKFVDHHLQEAIKSGQVLVSEKRVPQNLLNSQGELEKLKGFLYVSRNSSLLVGNVLKLTVRKVEETSRPNTDAVSIRFLPKVQGLTEKNQLKHIGWGFLPRKADTTGIATGLFESKKGLISKLLRSFVSKTRLAERRVSNQRLGRETLFNHGERKSLSHLEKLCLFRALSDQPLPFLDIHGSFGVSKQTVKGFVKKGFLEEEWGPRDIGVKFRLTEKGRSYLKHLEAAARFEPQHRKNIFIRLKHVIFS